MTPAVEIRQLVRTYPPGGKSDTVRAALSGVDLNVAAGEVHGLLGPNGAGKTTLCKILSTVLLPTSGTASVYGFDVTRQARQVRPLIGIVFGGERGLYTRLSARQNLRYWAALYRVPLAKAARRTDQLLDRVGLLDRADDRVETYSRGMKQRLHLARGLIGNPRLVILDEPTSGMDPVAAREFRALARGLSAEGRTVLLTTHDMTEAESLCDRVSLIDRGLLLGTESPRTIGRWLSAFERVDASGVPEPVAASLPAVEGVARVEPTGPGALRVHTSTPGAAQAVLRRLLDAGVPSMATSRPSLEEVYLHLFEGRGLHV